MTVEITSEEYQDHLDGYDGLCLGCGQWTCGDAEPDACALECTDCGAKEIYGAEEALLMGCIEVKS